MVRLILVMGAPPKISVSSKSPQFQMFQNPGDKVTRPTNPLTSSRKYFEVEMFEEFQATPDPCQNWRLKNWRTSLPLQLPPMH